MRIDIELSVDPNQLGTLSMIDDRASEILGPFPLVGYLQLSSSSSPGLQRTSDGIAPGIYRITNVYPMAGASKADIDEFGRFGLIAMRPTFLLDNDNSEAVETANVYIHGGHLGEGGRLRASNGSLRLKNEHIHDLVQHLYRSEDIEVCIRERSAVKPAPQDAPLENRTPPDSLWKLVRSLPVAWVAMPGLFTAASTAQNCSEYDSGSSFSAIDFDVLLTQNGGDALTGYVPSSTSGVTIAGGLDLGTVTAQQLVNMGFQSGVVDELQPYLATGATNPRVGASAKAALNENPITLHPNRASQIDTVYYTWAANTIASLYNARVVELKAIVGTTFASLPMRYQTAMAGMYITNAGFEKSKAFLYLASGQWSKSLDALRNYGHDNESINRLARFYASYLSNSRTPDRV